MIDRSRHKIPLYLVIFEVMSVAFVILLYLYNWIAVGSFESLSIFSNLLFLVLVFCTTRMSLDWGSLILTISLIAAGLYSGYLVISAILDSFLDLPLIWDGFVTAFAAFQLFLLWHPSSTQWLFIKTQD